MLKQEVGRELKQEAIKPEVGHAAKLDVKPQVGQSEDLDVKKLQQIAQGAKHQRSIEAQSDDLRGKGKGSNEWWKEWKEKWTDPDAPKE